MKRMMFLGLAIAFILSLAIGCGAQQDSQKTNEELKSETRAELKAEQQAKQAGEKAVDSKTKPSLLQSYEVYKEYKYDLDGNGEIDSFKVASGDKDYVNLVVNENIDSIASAELTIPELLFNKYRLIKTNNSNKYVFAFFIASPPYNNEVWFYAYEKDTGIKQIGFIISNKKLEELFNARINNLTHNQVKLGTDTFSFRDVIPTDQELLAAFDKAKHMLLDSSIIIDNSQDIYKFTNEEDLRQYFRQGYTEKVINDLMGMYIDRGITTEYENNYYWVGIDNPGWEMIEDLAVMEKNAKYAYVGGNFGGRILVLMQKENGTWKIASFIYPQEQLGPLPAN